MLHDVGSQDGIDFLVMEYLDGQSIAQRLRKGALLRAQVLEVGAQIADALASAHRRGIVHRDLKPANIMLTKSGAKLLDFGLAKLRPQLAAAATGASALSTKSVATRPGVVMGTVPYMAPEQLEGKETDARTDLFAFGCVLYEMLTGRRAFGGDSEASVISAIMTGEPAPLSSLQPLTPPALDRLVRRCLKKDPDDRWQTATDVAEELRGISQDAVKPEGAHVTTPVRRRSGLVWTLAGVVALVAGLVTIGIWLPKRAPALTDKDTIVLANFENATKDADLDKPLADALSFKLYETPFLKVASADEIREALKLMKRAPDASVDAATAREICIRQGLKAYIVGSVSPLGSQYQLVLKAVDAHSGVALGIAEEQAASKEKVVEVLGRAAVDLRRKLGESLPSLARFNKPLPQATTSSLEAWKQFSLGDELFRKGDFRAASGYFERATQLDPDFALAYLRLAFSYFNSGQPREKRIEVLKRALELKDKVSERESLELASRDNEFRGDLDKAVELGRQWIRWYPRDPFAYHTLGLYLMELGQFEEAVEAERQAVQLGAGSAAIQNLALDLRLVGKSEEAEATLRQGLARGYESDYTHWSLCRLAAIRGDQAEMQRQVEWLKRSQNGRSRLNAYLEQQGLAVVSGRLKAADQLVQQTLEVFRQDKFFGLNPATFLNYEAYAYAAVGNCERARAAKTIDVLILCGSLDEAQSMAEKDLAANPENQLNSRLRYPLRMATIALQRGDYRRALTLSEPIVAGYRNLGGFDLSRLRGQAYLGLGDGKAAAAEFQQIVDRRGLDVWSINYPLAYVSLGRAWTMAGDLPKSRAAYQAFFTFWKDADPDLPVLKAAKAEYARLQ